MRSKFSRVVGVAAVAAAVCGFAANAAGAWQYYKAGDAGNPTTVSCITDGNWVLPATVNATTGKITLSAGGINTKKVVAGEGVCDLRGVLFTLDGVARASFQRNAGLFARAREGCLSGLQRGS